MACTEERTLVLTPASGSIGEIRLRCCLDEGHPDLHRDPTLWDGSVTLYWEDEG